jgi:integral membrane sensor domain MASE1
MTASGLMLRLAGLVAGYFAGAAFGIALTQHAGNIAPFWPPNALLLAVLLRGRLSRWPLWLGASVLAAFAANLLLIGEPALGATLSAVNIVEALVSAGLMRRFTAGQAVTLAERSHLLAFAAFGGIVGPAIAPVAPPPFWPFSAMFNSGSVGPRGGLPMRWAYCCSARFSLASTGRRCSVSLGRELAPSCWS